MKVQNNRKFYKVILIGLFLSEPIWAEYKLRDEGDPKRTHPKGFYSPIIAGEDKIPWEYEMKGDQDILSCTLENPDKLEDILFKKLIEKIKKELDLPEVDGLCKTMNNNELFSKMRPFFQQDFSSFGDLIKGFVGLGNAGSIFDLGGFAQCDIDLPELEDTALAKFCKYADKDDGHQDKKFSLSPVAALTTLTIDADGLPSFSGKENKDPDEKPKKVAKRKYPSGKTGDELFKKDGGILLSEAKDDPYGSTAKAFSTFDKATIVLKTLAAANMKDGDISELKLPPTKAESMDLEDEVVDMQSRMTADLNQFGDTLTRAIQNKLAEKLKNDRTSKRVVSLEKYSMEEKATTKEFFRSKESGLAEIYKGIEQEVKARMASEMLLMTADPNYIADPSEARAELIKPSQRNKFRYAALIQQEKNKRLKLKYALEIKRKQQMVDIVKQQALLRASVFRRASAKQEVKAILDKADESVKVN